MQSRAGLGKTHLLQAIANEAILLHLNKKIVFVTAEEFMSEFLESIRNEKVDAFKSTYFDVDMLLIDDIQIIDRKKNAQKAFLDLLTILIRRNAQIVISADRTPDKFAFVDESLKQFINDSVCVSITIPDFDTRVKILRKIKVAMTFLSMIQPWSILQSSSPMICEHLTGD